MPQQPATHELGPDGECTECGQLHHDRFGNVSCSGHVRYDRSTYVPGQPRKPLPEPRPCTRNPVAGATRCQVHGVNQAVKAAGEQRVTEQRAAAAMRRFGGPIDTTPTEALLDTVKWTAGYVSWLREKVSSAKHDLALTQRSTQTGKREESAWLDLLGKWSDRLVKVCEAAIRAGIEERRVRIAEQQGALVADVIRKILGDLELTPEQAATAGEAVPRHLRSLAG